MSPRLGPKGRARSMSDEDFALFQQELKDFRSLTRLSQRAAAAIIGAHELTWGHWERGKHAPALHTANGVRLQLQAILARERGRLAVEAHRRRKAMGLDGPAGQS